MMEEESRRKRDRKYYQDNREVILERRRECRRNDKEAIRERNKKYYRKIKLARPWVSHLKKAKERCNNPNMINYKYYGGKGIKFKLTMDEVKTLYLRDGAKDMKRPSIDRIYSDGNYAFGNCRFIELSENAKRGQINRWL